MKHKASTSDKQVPNEADEEYGIMTLLSARLDAKDGEVDKQQIRQRVYDFGRIRSCIVILQDLVSGDFGTRMGSS